MISNKHEPLALIAFVLTVGGACAQENARTAADEVATLEHTPCSECEIVLEEVAILGHISDPSSIQPSPGPCAIDRLSTGEFVMSRPIGGGQIQIYGPDGGPAIGVIGRPGRGPEEFSGSLRMKVAAGDTIHVLDRGNGRLVALTLPSTMHRSLLFSYDVHDFHISPEGRYVVHRGLFPGEEEGAVPFYVLDVDGSALARFGIPKPEIVEQDFRVSTRRRAGGLWSASQYRYELEAWDDKWELTGTFARDVDWFPPDVPMTEATFIQEPPPSWVRHLWEDSGKHLWTYSLVPDQEWSPRSLDATEVGSSQETFDTMVEVVDLAQMSVVAQRRFDGVLHGSCSQNLVYEIVTTDYGDTRAVIYRPRLVQP